MEFQTIKTAVAQQFALMSKYPLFRTGVEKDTLWATYLQSFPEGSNPVYKERTEHDCNCCKSFIRTMGNVVALIDGQLVSIWDVVMGDEPAYQAVADALATLAKSQPIAEPFLHFERTSGVDKNLQDTLDGIVTWRHFFVNIPPAYVKPGADIASILGEQRALHDVLKRSLVEITDDAVATVLELIAQNSLYRGEEHKFAVTEFQKLKDRARTIPAALISQFAWQVSTAIPASVSKIRNTSIGTLLVDLSEGMDLDYAVKAFEAKVAPTNYKRPTALVTKAMIEKAKQTITELGLGSALERRYATIDDITVNNILFADRGAKQSMGADVFDTLGASITEKPKAFDKVEAVSIEKFITDILPRAESIELLVENRHHANFVSLIAPVDPTAGPLFKWSNRFSWDYSGGFADAIKERVKAAGGNVEGELCCRLAWDYEDDLDFHMWEPDGGHVYFGNRRHKSACGGMLDVDANGIDGVRKDPCENIFYTKLAAMKEGEYRLEVKNFSRRSDGVGFEVEIDVQGSIQRFVFDKVLRSSEVVAVATLNYSKKTGLTIAGKLPSTQSSKTVWNVATQTFRPVNVMMMSPNHWDGEGVGNKHYFFMLDGCRNDGQARPFFNEHLKSELDPHRKTMEMVGAKLKTENSEHQLSGLGFSSTQRNDVVVRVKGSFTRNVKIIF